MMMHAVCCAPPTAARSMSFRSTSQALTVRPPPLANVRRGAQTSMRRDQRHRDTIPGTAFTHELVSLVSAQSLKHHDIRRSEFHRSTTSRRPLRRHPVLRSAPAEDDENLLSCLLSCERNFVLALVNELFGERFSRATLPLAPHAGRSGVEQLTAIPRPQVSHCSAAVGRRSQKFKRQDSIFARFSCKLHLQKNRYFVRHNRAS
jgi:hypothetical protein